MGVKVAYRGGCKGGIEVGVKVAYRGGCKGGV